MSFKTLNTQVRQLFGHRAGVALAGLSGLGVFGVALALLSSVGFGLPRPPTPTPDAARVEVVAPGPAVAGDSSATGIVAGHMAVGLRLKADSVPLAQLHPDAVLDVLVTLPDGPDGPGLVGPVVSGARVVAVTVSSDYADVLIEAPADATMLLGHLVRRGLPLAYTVRQVADQPRATTLLTLDEARARLALAPRVPAANPTLAPSTPAPSTPAPSTPAPAPSASALVLPVSAGVSEVHFVVYAGVDLDLIKRRFGVTEARLLAVNPQLVASEPLVPGVELVIPDLYGFFYRVQSGDTLESLGQRYEVSSEQVRLVNDLPANVGLRVGDGVLIPAGRLSASQPAALNGPG